jgi:DNA-binding transcriptional LysR family regulator
MSGPLALPRNLSVPESIDIKLQLAAIALAQERSYPRAAERLNISVRTLGRRIRKLESFLEFNIFQKTDGLIELTKNGEVFVMECQSFVLRSAGGGGSQTPDH